MASADPGLTEYVVSGELTSPLAEYGEAKTLAIDATDPLDAAETFLRRVRETTDPLPTEVEIDLDVRCVDEGTDADARATAATDLDTEPDESDGTNAPEPRTPDPSDPDGENEPAET